MQGKVHHAYLRGLNPLQVSVYSQMTNEMLTRYGAFHRTTLKQHTNMWINWCDWFAMHASDGCYRHPGAHPILIILLGTSKVNLGWDDSTGSDKWGELEHKSCPNWGYTRREFWSRSCRNAPRGFWSDRKSKPKTNLPEPSPRKWVLDKCRGHRLLLRV